MEVGVAETQVPEPARRPHLAIVGAGFGGIGAGIRLRQRGFDDFLIFDEADDVGGTWRDNTYPGCACDVPSHLYSYSFARNPGWSGTFSGQAEIWEYLRRCVARFDLTDRLRLRHAVHEAVWDDARQRWRLSTSQGTFEARVLISATGPLSQPAIPKIDGLDSFAGTVFHSARWRHDHDLAGQRVAVLGTGASAAQFVPEIQPAVEKLVLFQRTAAWVMPRLSRRITPVEHALFRFLPGAQQLVRTALYWGREAYAVGFLHPWLNRFAQRLSLGHLRRQVRDPALRAKLTPDYVLGCKRVLLSNDFWASLDQDNIEVVTDRIARVEPDAVVTAGGARYPVDTIILGTGFRVTEPPVAHQVYGRDGVSLAQAWTPSMRAHLGTTVPGFPNLFILLGPNTGLGHSSVVLMIEAQLRQVMKALTHLRRTGAATIEPTRAAQQRYTERVDAKMAGTVWTTGCASWYLDASGRNSTLWPGYATGFRLRLSRFRPGDYVTAPPVPGRGGGWAEATAQRRSAVEPEMDGKVVLITGAARGIGAHTARLAAARGARLALVGLEPDRLGALATELGAQWAECDVTDQSSLDAAVAAAAQAYGRIDVVVANAGVANLGTVALGPVDALARTVDVNLTGVIRTVSAALPHLVAARGYALLVSSAAAFTAMPGMAAYAASKAGVEQFGNVLRQEVAHLGVAVGTAHPVWIDTDLVRGFRDDLPSFRDALRKLPWPLRTVTSVQACARALVRAVERRQRRVYVPRSIAAVQAFRTVTLSRFADWLVARGSRDGALIEQMEDEVRRLGRSFGSHSAAPHQPPLGSLTASPVHYPPPRSPNAG